MSRRSNKDVRQNFQSFKQNIIQILEAYERTVSHASSIESAEIQVVAFGRLLVTKMNETFPNLKDDIFGPLGMV